MPSDRQSGQRCQDAKDTCLEDGERGSTEELAERDGCRREGRHQGTLEESLPSVFDDGDRREDRREEHDQDQCAGEEIGQVTSCIDASSGVSERGTES